MSTATMMKQLKKNSKIAESSMLSESIYFTEKYLTPTKVPMLNVALSGLLDGGFACGGTMFAGPSKHFKTAFSLMLAKAYMDHYPDAIMIFYDSEFGTPIKYFETFQIDMTRVLHCPIVNVEVLKFDIMAQLEGIKRGDHVILVIDSIGNLASKKEVEDSLAEKSVADMTRAKQIKSLFRMVTPHLNMKDIPMIVVNHTYKEMAMFPKDIVSGGTGSYYSCDNIFIVGRQQDKDGTELLGYNFIINVEKSRFVKEKSKIPITVSFEGGIEPYSGLMDVALEGGFVINPTKGYFCRVYKETGEVGDKLRLKDTLNKEFWQPILDNKEFKSFVEKKYSLAFENIMQSEPEAEKAKVKKGKK